MLEDSSPPPPELRTFGMKKKVFWILTVLTLIIISAVLAGTIGGLLSKRSKASSSTTKKEKSTMLFLFQTWENGNQTRRSQIFDRDGLYTTAFKSRSYSWIPGYYVDDGTWDMCSMSFCQGDHQLSWRGSSERVGVNAMKWQGYEYGDTVVVRYGSVFADPGCPLNREGVTMTPPIYDPPVATALTGTGGFGNSSLPTIVTTTSVGLASVTAKQTVKLR